MSKKELKAIEKKITLENSLDAMEFGSERDLRIALTELRWIKRTKGKLVRSDFETMSDKYEFPIDFLRKGLEGLYYPEDYLVSKSKWFPIIYSWRYRERELGLNLFKFQIDYVQALFRFSMLLVVLGAIMLQMGFTLQNLLDLDVLQFLSVIIFPFAFFFISLGAELRNSVTNKKMKLDEYSTKLKEEGFHQLIANNEQFIREHYKMIAYAGGTLLKKMRVSPSLSFFYIGTKEEKKPIRLSMFSRFLVKLHLLPKPSFTEKERIPIFYGENPFIEYRRRIEELAESKSKQK